MYEPGRKDGYEYIWELMNDIEEKQCRTCAFSKLVTDKGNEAHAEEYPMCYEVEGEIVSENGPVKALDKTPDRGVVCTSYRSAELVSQETNQGVLFEPTATNE